jgi:hypothetical protein
MYSDVTCKNKNQETYKKTPSPHLNRYQFINFIPYIYLLVSPVPPPSSPVALKCMSFLVALQRLTKIIKDTKQAITKEGYASTINLEVGKNPPARKPLW